MKANQAEYRVKTMCRLLGVSRSGYYDWLTREPSPHAVRDAELTEKIRTIHGESRGTYGSPRVHIDLAVEQKERVGRKRVARLMRAAGLVGVSRRKTGRTLSLIHI